MGTKITALTAITSPDDTDVLAVADVSVPETKKITTADLRTAMVTAPAVLAALAGNSNPVAVNAQPITGVADPSSAQDAATKAYVDTAVAGGGIDTLSIISPATPGTSASINQNMGPGQVAGAYVMPNVNSPAGEPATAASPYYLYIADGVNNKYVVVLDRTGSSRTLGTAMTSDYSSGVATIAFAGYVTAPVDAGLQPATDFARLKDVEPAADRTTFARVAAAMALADTPVDFNSVRLTSIDVPTGGTDGANKNYVDGAIAAAVPDPKDRVKGFDDFNGQPGMNWAKSTGGDGSVSIFESGVGASVSGEGWAAIVVSDPSDDASIVSRTFQQLDTTIPMEMEARFFIIDESFTEQHDECTAFVGWRGGFGNFMGLSIVDPGSAELQLWDGATLYTAAVVLPTLAVGETWRFRFSATTSGVTVYGAVDDTAETLLATIAQTPAFDNYARGFLMTGVTPVTYRILMVDYVKWSGGRLSDTSPDFGTPSFPMWDMDVAITKALAQPKDMFDLNVEPNNTNDNTEGYSKGSHWVNGTSKQAWICTDATTSAAVWRPVCSGPMKSVGSGTYTVLDEDDGAVLRFTVPCVVTVPTTLRSGHETTMYCTTGVLEFADASAGVADPLHAASLSRFSSETMAIVGIKMQPGSADYILIGDLLPSTPDPITDGDFTSAGRMVRAGAGVYSTIFDNLIGVTDPTVGDDLTLGYAVGSIYVNTVTGDTFVCVDASAGAASWRQSSLSVEDFDMIVGLKKIRSLWWDTDLAEPYTSFFAATLSGTGASMGQAATGLTQVYPSTGTTSTGASTLRMQNNNCYTSPTTLSGMVIDVRGGIYDALPNGVDDFIVITAAALDSTFVNSGFGFIYNPAISANWQAFKLAAGVYTYQDTGVAAAGGEISAASQSRYTTELIGNTTVGTINYYIDGVLVATTTSAVGNAVVAGYVILSRIVKTLGTGARRSTVDWTRCYIYNLAPRT